MVSMKSTWNLESFAEEGHHFYVFAEEDCNISFRSRGSPCNGAVDVALESFTHRINKVIETHETLDVFKLVHQTFLEIVKDKRIKTNYINLSFENYVKAEVIQTRHIHYICLANRASQQPELLTRVEFLKRLEITFRIVIILNETSIYENDQLRHVALRSSIAKGCLRRTIAL